VDGKKGHCVAEKLPHPVADRDFLCVCKANHPSR
jgi:hypothetical protein